jgi:hypothetical protein
MFTVFLLIVVALAVTSALNPNRVQPITVTTSILTLSPSDFNVNVLSLCVHEAANGLSFLTLSEYLSNDRNMPFHVVSEKIVLLNYTLTNGTVVTVNRQWVDYNQSFSTISHIFTLKYNLQQPESASMIRNVEFTVAANIRELGEPYVQEVTVPVGSINC